MYKQPDKERWTGRIDSESEEKSFRVHQKIRLLDMRQIQAQAENAFALLGFQCDEGVRRNQGRQGAYHAPVEVKKALANLPWHLPSDATLYDAGEIACDGEELENSQKHLGQAIERLIRHRITPVVIGGGHETAYGHYLGVRQAVGPETKLGIINIDAHFDMRPYEQGPSSGTMFRQILDEDENAGYCCLGIQTLGNTAALFETAKRYGCTYMLEEELTLEELERAYEFIDDFIKNYDVLVLTLCMDVLSASAAPGVSAPSPFGLDPKIVRALLRYIISKPQTISFDICEVNPLVDENRKTIALAAAFCMEALVHFHRRQRAATGR
ncbi:Formimidoylglutamase [Parageobacillus caldoxylosilyticus]|uniref:formimidoylglutamase n=1 Tax=Saccharococcus caldoxylosilyticus TaxID=81408 RepID=UPI001C4E036B|nr:formimidoylglutamase [Parageobacillus caldoxylosilyticus]QXJ37214.1 Formimidoylglutamase [Parageobacillus caldoxylosilyticus]